jgi:phosphatidylglycerophosphate synthase
MVADENALHVRQHGSLLAGAERRLLVWMAIRLPRWINSDHLTALGFSGVLMAGAAFAAAARYPRALLLVATGLAVNWFGDSLDGTLARVRQQQRPRYGFYVDHLLDMIGALALLCGMAASGYMHPLLALGLLAAYLLVNAEEFLATHVRRLFRLSFLGFGPTELRIILATGALYLLHSRWAHIGPWGTFRLFDVGGVVSIAGMAVKLAVSAVRNTRTLYEQESLPARGGGENAPAHPMPGVA